MPTHYCFNVESPQTGMRLDQVIPHCCEGVSRTLARKIIDIGGVHLQGRRVRKCASIVKPGDAVEVFIDGRDLTPYRVDAAEVLYRDKYVLALNKPAGVAVQPTPARYKGTIYAAMLEFLYDPFKRHLKPELAMVQRLDRDTSGVLVFSIHKHSHKALTQSFSQRRVGKRYLAVVEGVPPNLEGRICTQLARNRASGRMKSVEKGGREAITCYRVLQQGENCALLEVTILTGRTHQIRVHLSEAGLPIAGDSLYGGCTSMQGQQVQRTMLHAWQLEFAHPLESERTMKIQAPLPTDFSAILSHAGLNYAAISQY